MNRILKSAILAFTITAFSSITSTAQLVVDGSLTPEELVEQILVGEGVTVSNITYTGVASQRGYFDGTNSNIGLDGGVILSSGDINIAVGPNNAGGAGSGVGGAGDADLAALAGVASFDAVLLEFDFIPTGDSLKFNYVFASEEYNEYTCAGVNDVFGFFLSGPGISGPFTNNAANIALIPGTNTPVSINTVNIGVAGGNGNAANCDALDPNWPTYNTFFTDNPAGPTIQYDGFTVQLTAEAEVQCGETYHIKLALSDGGDGVFDSGVFLEENSFSSRPVALEFTATSSTGIPLINDTTLVEGCTQLSILVTREESDSVLVSYLNISGTATFDVDYLGLVDSLVFEIGQDSAWIFLDPIADGISDNGETVTIGITSVDECGNEVVIEQTFVLVDQGDYVYNLNVEAVGEVFCPGDSIVLTADPDGGVPNFVYDWGNGQIGGSITIFPLADTTVTVSALDDCNTQSVEETLNLTILYEGLPTVTTSNDVTLSCPGDEADLTAVGAGFGSLDYLWDNGAGNTSTVTVQPAATTTYTVTVTDDCDATVTGDVLVTVNPYSEMQTFDDESTVICPGDTVEFPAVVQGGLSPFQYTWSNGTTLPGITVMPETSTDYTVNIIDECGLEASASYSVVVPTYDLQLTPIIDSTICELGEIELFVMASGGALDQYTYNWSGQDIVSSTSNDSVFVSSTESIATPDDSLTFVYQVDVTDYCGNAQSRSIEVTIRDCELVIPNVFTPGVDGFNDYLVVANVDQYPNSTLRIYNRWGFCVFESENYQNDWNGGKMEAGVYYYLFFPSDSDIEPMTGYVHLMTQNN